MKKNKKVIKVKASERIVLHFLSTKDLTIPEITAISGFCSNTIDKLVKQLQDEKKIAYRPERKKGRRVFYKI